MELFHLRYFVAVAEELNFSRAAARLSISASPLSQRIKDLERALGTTLFVRSPQYVALTPSGQMLLPQARDIVERFDSLVQTFARTSDPDRVEELRIGVAPDVTIAVRQRVVAAVRSVDERLHARFVPGSTAELTDQVREHALDLALVHGGRTAGVLQSHLVERQPVGVALSSNLDLATNESVLLEDLRHLAWATINHQAAPSVYRRTDALLTRHGVLNRAVLDSINVGDLLHLVLEGNAFALVGLQAGATRKTFVGEPVSILTVENATLSLPTSLIWRSDVAHSDSRLDAIVAVLRRSVAA